VLLGLSWLWTFGFTSYHPEQRPYGLAAGVLVLITGFFLYRRARAAIVVSALASVVVAIAAVLFIPAASGPGILVMVGLAVPCGLYAALAGRVLLEGQK
jgi:hypothetical protein